MALQSFRGLANKCPALLISLHCVRVCNQQPINQSSTMAHQGHYFDHYDFMAHSSRPQFTTVNVLCCVYPRSAPSRAHYSRMSAVSIHLVLGEHILVRIYRNRAINHRTPPRHRELCDNKIFVHRVLRFIIQLFGQKLYQTTNGCTSVCRCFIAARPESLATPRAIPSYYCVTHPTQLPNTVFIGI